MSQPFENLIFNPAVFAPDRTEVDLSALGIRIGEDGPDYGESSVEVERVRQAIGEGITDRRWPMVDCTVPLLLGTDPSAPLAEAVNRIEATAAEIMRRGGGWIERKFADAGGFAGSVACPVDTVGLSGIQGRTMGRGELAPEVLLKLSRFPIWYATTEILGPEVKASEVRDLKWEIAKMLGTAPGLIRVRVKNEGATDWRGAMACIESDYLSTAATADLAYDCEKLTVGSTAEVKERTGASGGKVVRAKLTGGWIKILGSEIAGVGPMTHIGVRRPKLRVFDGSERTNLKTQEENRKRREEGLEPLPEVQPQLQLEYRVLGGSTWSPCKIVQAPLVGNFSIIDLGECRPELAILGNQQWEWRLMGRVLSGTAEIDLDRVQLMDATEMLVVSAPGIARLPDGQSTKSPGTVTNEALGGGKVKWEEASRAKTTDGFYATAELNGTGQSLFLVASNFGFTIPETATVSGIIVAVRRSQEVFGHKGIVDDTVVLVGVTGPANKAAPGFWPHNDATLTYGGSTDLWDTEGPSPAMVNATGFGAAIRVNAAPEGGLACKAKIDSIAIGVYYVETRDENRVCYAGRSLEFRSEGVYRQHPTEDTWGFLIPEAGSAFHAPPGGIQNRSIRGILVPSVGDLGELPDSSPLKLGILPGYHPGYLAAREAA